MKRVAIITKIVTMRRAARAGALSAARHPGGILFAAAAALVFLTLVSGPNSAGAPASKDQELFNQGKILIFDKNWEGARGIFQRVIQEFPQSPLVPQAFYFIARCYQFQGRESEAIGGYETFLNKYPSEPVLPAEARNAIVELSASLMEKGDSTYRDRLIKSLSERQKDVRYFAAIRCSRLKDKQIATLSVPILREIVRSGSERDLVDRARIALLRIDPEALNVEKAPAPKTGKPERSANVRMFHLEVFQKGAKEPNVELNLPMALAEMAVRALDESTKEELRKKGFDVDDFWQSFKQLSPMQILTIRDKDNLVKIWID